MTVKMMAPDQSVCQFRVERWWLSMVRVRVERARLRSGLCSGEGYVRRRTFDVVII